MRVDVKKIKDNLTLDDYDAIITELGIPITQRNDDVWRLKSMCHAKDEKDCDSNLVFYTNERTFTCFSHQCIIGGDIFELIKHKIAQATTSSEWNIPLCVPIVKISFRSLAVTSKELKILMFIKIPP